MSRKGFIFTVFAILFVSLLILGSFYWSQYILDRPINNQNVAKGKDNRSEINRILSAIDAKTIDAWFAHPECGPVDEFYGTYGIIGSNPRFSSDNARELLKYAAENNLDIHRYGLNLVPPSENFSVSKDNWQLTVLYSDGGIESIRGSVSSLEEVPADLAANKALCG